MKTEEIEALIDRLEDDRHCSCYADGPDAHWCDRCQAASALRFLLEERKNLVHATSEGRLTQNGQLHAEALAIVEKISRISDGRDDWDYSLLGEAHEEAIMLVTRMRPLPSPPQSQGDRSALPSDERQRETKTSGENP